MNFCVKRCAINATIIAILGIFWFTDGKTAEVTTFRNITIGGGGFITGISISDDGTKVIKTDAGQAWIATNADPTWRLLVTSTNIPSKAEPWTPYEVVIAPTDSSRIYIIWGGKTYVSSNTGLSFTATAFPNVPSGPGTATNSNQGASRLTGKRIAVDPKNPDVVYIGYPENGVYVSYDAGATTSAIATIPPARMGGGLYPGYALAIDGSSDVVNGRSSVVYVHPSGSQVYRTIDAGSKVPTWESTTGGPTSFNRMAIDSNSGTLYVVDDSGNGTGSLWVYNGAWVNPNARAAQWHAVCVDPAVPNRIALVQDGGYVGVSTNAGRLVTNLGNNASSRVASDVPWLAITPENYMSTADCMFDPSGSNLMYLAEGIGVWKTSPVDTNYVWSSQTAGIENLVANQVLSSPSYPGQPVLASWDRPLFKVYPNTSTFPSTQKPGNNTPIVMGWSLDYASSAPGTVCSLVNWYTNVFSEFSGCSTDGGMTWKRFPTSPVQVLAIATAATPAGNSTITMGDLPVDLTMAGRTSADLGPLAVTNATTAANSNVLHFASVPAGVEAGQVPYSLDNPAKISFLSVISKTSTTVTLNGNVRSTLSPGERIVFNAPLAPYSAQTTVTSATTSSVTLSSPVANDGVHSGDIIQFCASIGGSIAVASPNNIIIVPQNNAPYPFFTTDGGMTWKNIIIGNSINGFDSKGAAIDFGDGAGTGWGLAYYNNNRYVAADRVLPNTFYLYNSRTARNGGGVYRSADGGITWTLRHSGQLANFIGGQDASIRSVPGFAGHLFIQGGSMPPNGLLARSDDGGATWRTLSNIDHVSSVGFGAPKPGGNGYPTVFFAGRLNGRTEGIFRSDDMPLTTGGKSPTWTQISDPYPVGWLDYNNAIEGDQSVYGTVYVARGSSGWAVGTIH